ncbi:ribosomal protein L13 domain-containing protein [Irpex lacteus]|nr:ribosomal protein L13 domain-containing protein [Irpex lacteus]
MSQAVGKTALAYARVWHHLAERIALVLMGKQSPYLTLVVLDCGDYVIVSNARNIKVTGRKAEQIYQEMMRRKPDEIIRKAVSGMLPKNKLRERRLERLRIFEGEDVGVFRHNILKRWEDGTLHTATQSQNRLFYDCLTYTSL